MIDFLVISGPTGVGKTGLAESVAESQGCEIISGDSQAVYRGLDIGTAKPRSHGGVHYHLTDIADPRDSYNVSMFVSDAELALESIHGRGSHALVAGGSPMYIDRLLKGLSECPAGNSRIRARLGSVCDEKGSPAMHAELAKSDPAYAGRIHPNDRKRIIRALEVYELTGRPFSDFGGASEARFNVLYFILNMDRKRLYGRIERRVDEMMAAGWVNEIRALLEQGLDPHCPGLSSLGYRELTEHISGGPSLQETVDLIKKRTRHFARRQLIWLRKVKNAIWLDAGALGTEDMTGIIKDAVEKEGGMR